MVEVDSIKSPMMVIEPWKERRPKPGSAEEAQLIRELKELMGKHSVTQPIEKVVIYPQKLPVDIRHNSKIFREKLSIGLNKRYDRNSLGLEIVMTRPCCPTPHV